MEEKRAADSTITLPKRLLRIALTYSNRPEYHSRSLAKQLRSLENIQTHIDNLYVGFFFYFHPPFNPKKRQEHRPRLLVDNFRFLVNHYQLAILVLILHHN